MNYCTVCKSFYDRPGTCNCYAAVPYVYPLWPYVSPTCPYCHLPYSQCPGHTICTDNPYWSYTTTTFTPTLT
jgi:hypothetical protein